MSTTKKKYYVVRKGKTPGIYFTWADCKKQVNGFKGAEFKGFATLSEAENYLELGNSGKADTLDPDLSPVISNPPVSTPESVSDKDKLNPDQKAAYDLIMSGNNVFLTGNAGTGKSYLLDCVIHDLKKTDKNVIVCASTGIAAVNIKGATIHSVFGINKGMYAPDEKIKKIKDVVKAADVIIIDEISMCRLDIFSYVCRYIMKAEKDTGTTKQTVICGDFFQLPPVLTPGDKEAFAALWGLIIENPDEPFAFKAPEWSMMAFRPVVLQQVMRQNDTELLSHLDMIRWGDAQAVDWFNKNCAKIRQPGIRIYGNNKIVAQKNEEELLKLGKEIVKYKGVNDDFIGTPPTEQTLSLCVGARVMSLVNDGGRRYQNGSLGTVKKMDKDGVTVDFDNGKTAKIGAYTWDNIAYSVENIGGVARLRQDVTGSFTQIPLKLAFAVTIHKSQGQTYDSANFSPNCFAAGQLYVALSRVTDISRLYLEKPIKERDLITAECVKDFYFDFLSPAS